MNMNWEIYELIEYLAKKSGYCETTDDIPEEDLDDFIQNRYEINLETFSTIINDLLPLCDKGESPLTGKLYQGFGTGRIWLIKREVFET